MGGFSSHLLKYEGHHDMKLIISSKRRVSVSVCVMTDIFVTSREKQQRVVAKKLLFTTNHYCRDQSTSA